MDKASKTLLELLKASLGIVPEESCCLSVREEEWRRLIDMAFDGGVSALSVDGYNAIRGNQPTGDSETHKVLIETEELVDMRIDWFGSVLDVEEDYWYKFNKAAGFASALDAKGVECKVLKGMSFASYYGCPEHRECGDCDVYLGSDWATGNMTAEEIGGRYEFGTYKHSHLFLGKLMIENHRFLTDFNGTRQGKRIERLLQGVIEENPGREIGGSRLMCPNDHFNALFLIRHAYGNFINGGMSLRMVYDWAALLLSCGRELDWVRLWNELGVCRLHGFARVMNSLCVEFLGVPSEAVGGEVSLCPDRALVEEVMRDTLDGGINPMGLESFRMKCVRIGRRFMRIWRYRGLATESVPRLIWNNFAFSSYMKRNIGM